MYQLTYRPDEPSPVERFLTIEHDPIPARNVPGKPSRRRSLLGTALQVWGAISLAGVVAAGGAYAHRGLDRYVAPAPIVAAHPDRPAQAAPLKPVAPASKQAAVAPAPSPASEPVARHASPTLEQLAMANSLLPAADAVPATVEPRLPRPRPDEPAYVANDTQRLLHPRQIWRIRMRQDRRPRVLFQAPPPEYAYPNPPPFYFVR